MKAEALRFSENGVREVLRKVMLPLWNAYSFFVTYANIDGWTPTGAATGAPVTHQLDRWILSSLQTLIADVNTHMDRYQLYRVVPRLDGFIDDLTNWYIRRSRQRFWSDDDPADKASAYRTLYDVLVTYAKVLAPVLPFVCEEMYRNLVSSPASTDRSRSICATILRPTTRSATRRWNVRCRSRARSWISVAPFARSTTSRSVSRWRTSRW